MSAERVRRPRLHGWPAGGSYRRHEVEDNHPRLSFVFERMRPLLILSFLIASSSHAQPIGRLVDIGGRRLHLVCMGSGFPTVILESGAAEGFYTWWLVQNQLRNDVRTCSYDRAGFGWSDPTPSRSIASYV